MADKTKASREAFEAWLSEDGKWPAAVERDRNGNYRLAWLYVTGDWPKRQIDHINRDGLDNRIANLRDVTPSTNCRNTWRKNLHGQGVAKNRGATWHAKIDVDGKQVFLGNYISSKEAEAVFLAARALHSVGSQAMLDFAREARERAAKIVAATKNQVVVDGVVMSLPKAAKRLGIPERTMYYRFDGGVYSHLQEFSTNCLGTHR